MLGAASVAAASICSVTTSLASAAALVASAPSIKTAGLSVGATVCSDESAGVTDSVVTAAAGIGSAAAGTGDGCDGAFASARSSCFSASLPFGGSGRTLTEIPAFRRSDLCSSCMSRTSSLSKKTIQRLVCSRTSAACSSGTLATSAIHGSRSLGASPCMVNIAWPTVSTCGHFSEMVREFLRARRWRVTVSTWEIVLACETTEATVSFHCCSRSRVC